MKKLIMLILMLVFIFVFSGCSNEQSLTKSLNEANVGDLVTMGTYEQDGDESNGKEPIEWRVLDRQEGKVLLISNIGLEQIQLNEIGSYSGEKLPEPTKPWQYCSLRKLLNDDFLSNFTEEEKELIITSSIDNGVNQETGIGDTYVTEDKFFVLSMEEARKYFADDNDRKLSITRHASAGSEQETGGWWLRTPGVVTKQVVYVTKDGQIMSHGLYYADYLMLRPSVWVTVNQ